MFTNPIKHTRLKSMDEVLNFSYRTNSRGTPLTRYQKNGQIAFVDQHGTVFVTPYRTEINSILEESGYKEEVLYVPFSNNEDLPEAYQWLVKIAEEENWAQTYEEAFQIASEKGIRPVEVSEKYQIKEFFLYEDTSTNTIYFSMVMKFLMNWSKQNIGTYILKDKNTLVVCDEYGRSFLIKAKTVVNDLVNQLLDAGYTRTVHPERYIRKSQPVID